MENIKNLEEVFSILNNNCNYLILRNFEDFFDDILLQGHNDIDVLCACNKDRKKMVDILRAEKRLTVDNGIHYKFLYKNKEISLDIRIINDGYYDGNWCKKMLKNRIYNSKGFYTMNNEDYYYSLIYHAIYQKKILSEDYLLRLRNMKKNDSYRKKDFEEDLFQFMKKNDYYYTIPYDKYVVMYFDNELINKRIKCPLSVKLKIIIDEFKDSYCYGKYNGLKKKIKSIRYRRSK